MAQDIPAWVEGVLRPIDKLEVHRRGLPHMAVSVFVMQGDRLLLQQRAAGKYHTPFLWANSCCTHPRWGETAEDCAHRRLAEELGLEGLELEHRGQVQYRAEVGKGMVEHEVVDVFLARVDNRPDVTPDLSEVSATRWVSLADLENEIAARPDLFTPWLKIYLEEHRELVTAMA